jgi:GT2 family glycosyltransferase
MEKSFTLICPIIRTDLVERMLETLYANTPPGTFYVYIIDQTIHGIDSTKLRNQYRNLMVIRTPKTDVHYTGNLGFAQGTDLGVSLVETPYFMMCNDDVEFMHPAWLDGVWETYKLVERATPDTPAIIVNPASARLADWSVGRAAGDDFDIIPYKEKFTDEDWRHLVEDQHYVNEHLTIQPGSVIDGVTLYASMVDTELYRKIGGMDHRYHPGAGEDYDFSCKARMWGYRCVGTTLSWVWHHWSMSFKDMRDKEEIQGLKIPELSWNHNHEKWGKGFDIWGYRCPKCKEIMLTDNGIIAYCPKDRSMYQIPANTPVPL